MTRPIAQKQLAHTRAVTLPRRRRFPAGRIPVGVAAVFLLSVVAMGAFGVPLSGLDPDAQDLMLSTQAPSAAHLLGTDDLGRDIFARVMAGTKAALVGPFLAALITITLGTLVGLISGMYGGWVSTLIMRAIDLVYAIPPMLVLLVVTGVLGGGYWTAVLIIALLGVPTDARLVHAVVSGQRELSYVEAAQTIGLSRPRIMIGHILPNILPTVVACVLIDFAFALVSLSGLSFLGLGVPAGTPDWGLMLAENRPLLLTNPWACLVPGLLLTLSAASMTVIGDRFYERMERKNGRG